MGPLTTELLLEELEELCTAQRVGEELTEVEAPALHPQLCGGHHPAGDTRTGGGGWGGCTRSPRHRVVAPGLPGPPRPLPAPRPGVGVRVRRVGRGPMGAYVGAFMAQYVVSSVIQGLLGRQPDMMGSWGTYCSLNLMYLPGAGAGGGQGRRPQPHYVPAVVPAASGDAAGPARGRDTCSGSAMSSALPTATAGAAHPSRQMDDFTRVLAMAFLQYSIWGRPRAHRAHQGPAPCRGAPSPTPSPRSPPACSSPCSWPARDARSRVRAWGRAGPRAHQPCPAPPRESTRMCIPSPTQPPAPPLMPFPKLPSTALG